MIGILGGMGTQAGLDFCNKLAVINRGKIDQKYPMFILYNKSKIPKRPENLKKYYNVLKSLIQGCRLLQKNKCNFIVMPCNTAHYWYDDLKKKIKIPKKLKSFAIELPPKNQKADISCNAAMVLAKLNNTTPLNYGKYSYGFIAQEVKEVVDKYNVPDHKSWAIDPDGRQRVSISSMTTVLIKAVQELSQQIEDLKKG